MDRRWKRVAWRIWILLSVLWTLSLLGLASVELAEDISEAARWDAEFPARSAKRLATIERLNDEEHAGVLDPLQSSQPEQRGLNTPLQSSQPEQPDWLTQYWWHPPPKTRKEAIVLLERMEADDIRPTINWKEFGGLLFLFIIAPQAVLLSIWLIWRWGLRPLGRWIAAPLRDGK